MEQSQFINRALFPTHGTLSAGVHRVATKVQIPMLVPAAATTLKDLHTSTKLAAATAGDVYRYVREYGECMHGNPVEGTTAPGFIVTNKPTPKTNYTGRRDSR